MDTATFALLLLYLLAGHALADFVLQHETMAQSKCPGSAHPAARLVPWYYWLGSHALLHGAVVGLIFLQAGVPRPLVAVLFAGETMAHALIDLGKCAGWYGIHRDQFLHLTCKLLWCLTGWVGPTLMGGAST